MPDLSFHELQHIQKLLQQQGSLKYIFDDFVKKSGNLLTQWNDYPSGDLWTRNQGVQKGIEEQMEVLRTKLTANIENYTTDAWNRSHKKSDELVDGFVKNLALNDVVKNGMYARNNEALQAFLKRKVDGTRISERVWQIAQGAKENIEFYLESGLSTGRSAALISQDIRQLLQEPDRRFHRIRNEAGKLVPSQPMKDYHPGTGVYRSSYKNALRLAATNTNEMYRLTDNERWNKLDFVLGYKVSRATNNYGPCAICDAMVGNYPKNYVFTGNHPFCICYATPILMNEDSFIDALVEDDFSNVKYIEDIPANSKKYIQDLIDNKKLSVDGYLLKKNKGFFDGSAKNIMPQKKVIEPIKPTISKVPEQLSSSSAYLKGSDIKFSNEFFSKFDDNKPVNLAINSNNNSGSYYLDTKRLVNISSGKRLAASNWYKESLVYHEYGHALDWQVGMRSGTKTAELMQKHRSLLSKKQTGKLWEFQYNYEKRKYENKAITKSVSGYELMNNRLRNLSTKFHKIDESYFTKRGITKADATEQLNSLADTLASLNPNYGWGHKKSYFKRTYAKEAEFIAHCFENNYAGNTIFKKLMPELYEDMIKYIQNY